MFKRFSLFFLLSVLLLLVIPSFYLLNSQSITVNQDKVAYNLPYPGILPDNPLFFIKEVRDKILEWSTRDNLKKAELYLLLSDKRVAMSQALNQKGKDKQALTTLLTGENYFKDISKFIEISKKQGASPSADFIQRLELSNAKHKEITEIFLKEMPQGQNEVLNQILELNKENKQSLNKF